MDAHQRRVLLGMFDEIDAFHRAELTMRRLVSNLAGLMAAADLKDERLVDEFWNRRNDLLMELDPTWFDGKSEDAIAGGEARFR